MSRKTFYLLLAVLSIFLCRVNLADAYQVTNYWTSAEGWEEETTNFTSNSDSVYINVGTHTDFADEGVFIKWKWYRPDDTLEDDVGTNILAHREYNNAGAFQGFWTEMVIKGMNREPGLWRVEHWAKGYKDGVLGWYHMATAYFTIYTTSDTTVTGTLTLPAAADGEEYWVLIDNDTDGDNGYISYTTGPCGPGTSVDYSISNVPAGTFYVYAGVRITSDSDSPPQGDDYFGYYDAGPPPTEANAVVPSSGTVDFDIPLMVFDSDTDEVPNYEEQGPDGTDPAYDGNNDGVPDCQQGDVASCHTHDGKYYVTLASPDPISDFDVIDNPSPADSPSGHTFQYGFFEFTADGLGPGGDAIITLYLPPGATPTSYYKYGPTPGDPTDHWYEFLFDGQTGAEINGNVITLHLVDGQRGDDDLTANGTISDPGGPGTTTTSGGGGGGGGGGCFIDTAAYGVR